MSREEDEMGVYLRFVVARSVPDLAHDNCFIFNAPSHGGLHSSHVSMLLEGVAKHATGLAAPAWYRNAFSLASPSTKPLTRDHFFDPPAILADLQRMQGIIASHPQDFPFMHWLRVGNEVGIKSLDWATSLLNIYHEGQPSTVFGGWNKVELRPGYPPDASQPRIDLTKASSFTCRLRSVNPASLDGLEVQVIIDRQTFGSVIAPDLENACAACRWADFNACMLVPFWS